MGDGLLLLNQLAIKDKHYKLTPLMLLPTEISLEAIEPWPMGRVDDMEWVSANLRLQISPAAEDDACGLMGLMPLSYSPILVMDNRMAPLVDVMPWLHAITHAVIETVTIGESPKPRPPGPDLGHLPSGRPHSSADTVAAAQ